MRQRDQHSKSMSGGLTEFGAMVVSLAATRGIVYMNLLARMITEHGEPASRASLHNWLYGKHNCPPRIARAIADVLALDDDERQRLANAYAYGQDLPARMPTANGAA